MKWSAIAVAACLPPASRCCSYVEIPYSSGAGSNGTAYTIGRTMELGDILGMTYEIETVPARVSGGRFGYVAPTNVYVWKNSSKKMVLEGMNEVGLTVSALEFDQSEYEAEEANASVVRPEDVVPQLLANYDSVGSALEFLEAVRVVPGGVMADLSIGLHWAIHDVSGRSVVVEYLQGTRVVYENTPRVLTNDPDLKWHWRNLNTYSNLNPDFPTQNDFLQVEVGHGVGAVPRTVGHGWNLAGMPGDSSPPARFARLFYLRGYALRRSQMKDESDAVVLGTALLNNVFIPYGVAAPNPARGGDMPEYTPFGVLKSPTEKKMLIRGYRNSQWRLIDLNRIDFSKEQSWPLEDGSLGIEDLTQKGRFV